MGLLDEAIREHLELKRRTGADPSAIARAEHEALAPVFPDKGAGADVNGDHSAHDGPQAAEIAPAGDAPAEDHRHGADRVTDLSLLGQETAELDMLAVMEEDPDTADRGSPVGPIQDRPVPAAYAGETHTDDSLEWRVPSERDRESAPDDVSGQERLSLE
jgi:hypothetical protein